MSSPSPQPSEAIQSDKVYWIARAETLKQKLMQRRLQPRSVQPAHIRPSQGANEQPTSDEHEPIQTRTTTIAGPQSTPGLSHQMTDDRVMHQEVPQLKDPSVLNTPAQSSANDSSQILPSINGNLMEKLSSPTPSKAAGKETNDALMAVNDAGRNKDTPSGANDVASAKVQDKPNDGARSKVQPGDDTASKEPHASRDSNKSATNPKDKPNTHSSTEEGEIKTSAPLPKIPVHELMTQPASRKKDPPSRASMVTNIAPTEPRAKRQFSNSLAATPDAKHRGVHAGAGSGGHSSASRSVGKHEHSRHSLPTRPSRTCHDDPTTWDAYKAAHPPIDHHVYARPVREQRPRMASPAESRPTNEDFDRDVQIFASRHPQLHEWLRLTGWYAPDFRVGELRRLLQQEKIDRESAELRREGDLAKARLKAECGEAAKEARHLSDAGHRSLLSPVPPRRAEHDEAAEYRKLGRYPVTAGIKREHSEDSDGDANRSSSAKYHRTNRNNRGSRRGYHGFHDSNRRGREDSRYWQNQGNMTYFPPNTLSTHQNASLHHPHTLP